jgi:hypothetical protein
MQHSSQLLMIQPVQFEYNVETAINNSFQVSTGKIDTQQNALKEFNNLVAILSKHEMEVMVIKDTADPHTPDSVFPNNWISFHEDGTLCLYPMFARNRRLERKQTVLDQIKQQFEVQQIIDFTQYEEENKFLEGTGSMVLDRENKIVYACISTRTNLDILKIFCEKLNYTLVYFEALDNQLLPIYHTNVMMCVADDYVIICLDSIKDDTQKNLVLESINATNKAIITISEQQLTQFAGNMLQVHNTKGTRYLVMSTKAYQSLSDDQIKTISTFNNIIHADISTIEINGGGSARCMIAEVFLKKK